VTLWRSIRWTRQGAPASRQGSRETETRPSRSNAAQSVREEQEMPSTVSAMPRFAGSARLRRHVALAPRAASLVASTNPLYRSTAAQSRSPTHETAAISSRGWISDIDQCAEAPRAGSVEVKMPPHSATTQSRTDGHEMSSGIPSSFEIGSLAQVAAAPAAGSAVLSASP
jgi:hypothetical protein